MNNMRQYKGIFVAKGSTLYDALDRKDEAGAKKIFDETSTNFQKLYSKDDDWKWFMSRSKV